MRPARCEWAMSRMAIRRGAALAFVFGLGVWGLGVWGLGLAAQANSPSIVVTYNVEYDGLVSLDVGRATVQYSSTGTGYQLTLSFRPSASARSLAVGPAVARTAGAISARGLSPLSTTLDYSVRALAETRDFTFAGDRLQTVHITKKKEGGLFRDGSTVGYDPRVLPAYAALSDADQKGVLDPLSAMLLPIIGPNALDRSNCERRLRMYDGRRRFDLVMSYRGVESAGAAGDALVCSATYVPIAGHSVDGDEFTETMRQYRIGVALVPAPGKSFLIPSRITLMDGSGTPVAEAKAVAISGR
ncbi:Protein of unknown function [Rhizobiales bacterium GAS113]|nr:Protein of unknown function [Rhizobiales bacterium GAS113]SEC13795.1 Protein of unknown function [Rhizobiales bacterium GAS188]